MVNTFLPFADFKQSAQCLDWQRLGKQRVEAKQIIAILESNDMDAAAKLPFGHHPAVKMWIGHVAALKLYFNECVKEWIRRGYKNNLPLYDDSEVKVSMPWFIGWPPFHLSHQASLFRKKTDFYCSSFSALQKYEQLHSLGYLWPSDVAIEMRSTYLTSSNVIQVCLSLCQPIMKLKAASKKRKGDDQLDKKISRWRQEKA